MDGRKVELLLPGFKQVQVLSDGSWGIHLVPNCAVLPLPNHAGHLRLGLTKPLIEGPLPLPIYTYWHNKHSVFVNRGILTTEAKEHKLSTSARHGLLLQEVKDVFTAQWEVSQLEKKAYKTFHMISAVLGDVVLISQR